MGARPRFSQNHLVFPKIKRQKNNFRSWGGSSTSNDGWPSQLGHSAFGVSLNDLGKVHLVSRWFSNCLIVWWKNSYALHGSCFMPSFLAKIGPFLWNSSVDLDGFGHRFMQSLSTQCPKGPVSSKRQDWNCLTVGLKVISNIFQPLFRSSWEEIKLNGFRMDVTDVTDVLKSLMSLQLWCGCKLQLEYWTMIHQPSNHQCFSSLFLGLRSTCRAPSVDRVESQEGPMSRRGTGSGSGDLCGCREGIKSIRRFCSDSKNRCS